MATLIGNVGMVMKGAWSSSAAYDVLNAVTYNGSLYIAKQNVPANTAPTDTAYWQPGAINNSYPIVEISETVSSSNPYSFDMKNLQHHFYIMEAAYLTGSFSALAVIRKINDSTVAYWNIKEPSNLLNIEVTGTIISLSVNSGYGGSSVRFIALY